MSSNKVLKEIRHCDCCKHSYTPPKLRIVKKKIFIYSYIAKYIYSLTFSLFIILLYFYTSHNLSTSLSHRRLVSFRLDSCKTASMCSAVWSHTELLSVPLWLICQVILLCAGGGVPFERHNTRLPLQFSALGPKTHVHSPRVSVPMVQA